MLHCKVDTAVQREHIEHVRFTEGVEYMDTLASTIPRVHEQQQQQQQQQQ